MRTLLLLLSSLSCNAIDLEVVGYTNITDLAPFRYVTGDVSQWASYGKPNRASFNTPERIERDRAVIIALVNAWDGFHIAVICDNAGGYSGRADVQITCIGDGCGFSSIKMKDDPGDTYENKIDEQGNRQWIARWRWSSCCTDGMLFGPLTADRGQTFQVKFELLWSTGINKFKITTPDPTTGGVLETPPDDDGYPLDVVIVATIKGEETLLGSEPDTSNFYDWGPLEEGGDHDYFLSEPTFEAEIPLPTPFKFFAKPQSNLRISKNGILSFGDTILGVLTFAPPPITLVPAIFPLWSDVDLSIDPFTDDTRINKVYYMLYNTDQTGDRAIKIMTKAKEDVQLKSKDENFVPTHVLVVTYYCVAEAFNTDVSFYYDTANSYQVVLIWNEEKSFVLYIYPGDGLHWPKPVAFPMIVDFPSIGFDAGDGKKAFEIRESRTVDVFELSSDVLFFQVYNNEIIDGINKPPVVWDIFPKDGNTAGGDTITIFGYQFGSAADLIVVTVGLDDCTVTFHNETVVKCILPEGQGHATVHVKVLSQSLKMLPSWERDMYFWETTTLATTEPGCIPTTNEHSWSDNHFCGNLDKADLKHEWSTQGPIDGMKCTKIADDTFGTEWDDTYYCLPLLAPYDLTFLANGPHTEGCVSFGEGNEWYLCSRSKQPYGEYGILTYPYGKPTISYVDPLNGPTSGGILITLIGSNFGPLKNGIVYIGSEVCEFDDDDSNLNNPVTTYNHTVVTCYLPPGENTAEITITVSGLTSTEQFILKYDPPKINVISPDKLGTSGDDPLTITGINFAETRGRVTIGNRDCNIDSWNNLEIICSPEGMGLNLDLVVTNAYQESSAPKKVNFHGPNILTIDPSTFSSEGNEKMRLTGSNFGEIGVVTVGGTLCPLTGIGYSHDAIECILPSGQGKNQPVIVEVASQVSNSVPFNYDTPNIISISPDIGSQGTMITVIGESFGVSGTLKVGGKIAVCQDYLHNKLICIVPSGFGSDQNVELVSAGITSNTKLFSYHPVIDTIQPLSGPTNGAFNVILQGTGFGSFQSSFIMHGAVKVTNLVHSNFSHLVYSCPPGVGALLDISVNIQGIFSDPIKFSYDKPTIDTIKPTSGRTSGNIDVTLIGKNFGSNNAYVLFGAAEVLSVVSVTHEEVVVVIPPGVGSGRRVTLSAGGQTSAANFFDYNAPVLNAVIPDHGPTEGNILITLIGEGFGAGGIVWMGSQQVSTSDANNTMVQFSLPKGMGILSVFIQPSGNIKSNHKLFTYDKPVVYTISPLNGPTDGQITLTITGSSFGLDPSVTVDGEACSPRQSFSHTKVLCTLPAGQSNNVSVIVHSGGQNSNSDFFSYDKPVLYSIKEEIGPTEGGTLLTIRGDNLGISGTVRIGGITCSLTSLATFWTHGVIQCILGEGEGSNLNVLVNAGDQQNSPAVNFSYSPPTLTTIIPNTVPTIGKTIIALRGNNFGLSSVVTVGSFGNCIQTISFKQTHRQIDCEVPGGQGQNLQVTITVASQTNINNEATLSYDAPHISAVSPQMGPTEGQIEILLSGDNFGSVQYGAIELKLKHSFHSAISISNLDINNNHTECRFLLPSGTGKGWTVELLVGSQPSTFPDQNLFPLATTIDYFPPSIVSVKGCPEIVGNATKGCSTQSSTNITITGHNFGSDLGIVVKVNGKSIDVTNVTHHSIICILPIEANGGFDLPITVIVDGQSSEPQPLISYRGPAITEGTLAFGNTPNIPGSPRHITQEWNTDLRVSLSGIYWSNEETKEIKVQFGLPGAMIDCWQPNNVGGGVGIHPTAISAIEGNGPFQSNTTCQIPNGVGKNLPFTVIDTPLSSAPSIDTFSYAPPSILDNSLRVTAVENAAQQNVSGTAQQNEKIFFNVKNVGISATELGAASSQTISQISSLLTVEYGPDDFLEPYTCRDVTLVHNSDPVALSCLTELGSGGPYKFRIKALNQYSALSTVLYSYPEAPIITRVSSNNSNCVTDGIVTRNCPTAGNVQIIVWGEKFSSDLQKMRVMVQGLPCSRLRYVPSPDRLFCTLPASAGNPANVLVTKAELSSEIKPYIYYAGPTVDRLSNTDCFQVDTSLIECPRIALQNAAKLTIHGNNFGPESATILIGESVCNNTVHISLTEISCVLPTGTREARNVLILQKGGILMTSTQTVSYHQCEPGKYATIDDPTCHYCPPGTFSDIPGSFNCKLCESGKYSNHLGASSCQNCPRGTFSKLNTTTAGPIVCEDCLPGTFGNFPGLSECEPCASGTFALGKGNFECEKCSAGTVQKDFGMSNCIPCRKGSFAAGEGNVQCEKCESGRFSQNDSATACQPCLAGEHSPEPGQSVCLKCALGEASISSGQSQCLPCDGGFFSNETGLTKCFECPAGKFSEKSETICRDCIPGKYNPTNRQALCLQCPKGSSNPEAGQIECPKCDAGYFANIEGLNDCLPCEKGTFSSGKGSAKCDACPIGSYMDTTAGEICHLCPQGQFQSEVRQSNCIPCNNGSAINVEGQAVCIECDSGTFAAIKEMIKCDKCPLGTFSKKFLFPDGSAQGPVTCEPCPNGRFGSNKGLEQCLPCPVGYAQNEEGKSSCKACSLGKASQTTGAQECSDCDPGTYASGNATIICKLCELGEFTDEPGAVECKKCGEGKYQNQVGQKSCIFCSRGQYAHDGQAQCSDCPSGQFANASGSSSCQSCLAGTKQSNTGKSKCESCESGRFINTPGQLFCQPCDTGQFANQVGLTTCESCESGYSQPSGGMAKCNVCPPGTLTSAEAQPVCSVCLPGQYAANNASSECQLCLRGSFQPEAGMTSCKLCPAGTYINADGQVECIACDAGFYAKREGQTKCEPCPIGKVSTKNILANIGPTTCFNCPSGTYMNAEGQDDCLECKVGEFGTESGMVDCHECSPGYFNNLTKQKECQPCEVGHFSQNNGSILCFRCPSGQFSAHTNQAECTQCPKGYMTPYYGLSSCEACKPGEKQPAVGQTICMVCNPGQFSSQNHSTNCTTCPAGKTQPSTGDTICYDCSRGQYQKSIGSTECIPCEPGRFVNLTGSTDCTRCPGGYYQGDENAVGCNPCPVGRAAPHGETECKECPPKQVAPFERSEECLACLDDNAITNPERTRCICKKGFCGRLPNNTHSKSLACELCPPGANCDDSGLLCNEVNAAPGSWEGEKEFIFYKCQLRAHCPGGAVVCDPTRTGPICANCIDGYTENMFKNCKICAAEGTNYLYSIIVFLVAAAALLLMYIVVLRAGSGLIKEAKKEVAAKKLREAGYVVDNEKADRNIFRHRGVLTVYGPPPPKPNFSFKLKIALGFAQIVTNLAIGLDIEWPDAFKEFIFYFNILNLDFFQGADAECVVDWTYPTYLIKLWALVSMPILILSALFLFYLLPKYMCSSSKRVSQDFNLEDYRQTYLQKFWRLFIFTLFLIYPSVSSIILRLYPCIEIQGVSYLRADMSQICTGPDYVTAKFVAIPFIFLYPIGIPLFFFCMLFQHRKRLRESGTRAQLGLLYDAYEWKVWYFEMCDMAHKLILTSLLAFIPNKRWQMPIGMFVAGSYLGLILLAKPYLGKGNDRLHIFAQSELLLLMLAGYIFNEGEGITDTLTDVLLAIVLISMLLTFMAYIIFSSSNEMRKLCKHSAKCQEFTAWFEGQLAEIWCCQKLQKRLPEKTPKRRIGEEFYEGLEFTREMEEKKIADWNSTPRGGGGPTFQVRNPLNKITAQTTNADANYQSITNEQLAMNSNPLVLANTPKRDDVRTKGVPSAHLKNRDPATSPINISVLQPARSPLAFPTRKITSPLTTPTPIPGDKIGKPAESLESTLDDIIDLDDDDDDDEIAIPRKKKIPTKRYVIENSDIISLKFFKKKNIYQLTKK